MMITKAVENFENVDFSGGEVILIDKDEGLSSFDIIRRLRKITGVKKIGHAGTLDPKASGLVILCTGKKTKSINEFQTQKKTYSGIITLGKTTPSMDSETPFDNEYSLEGITEEKVEEVRKSFLGRSLQLPPMYSAVKHKGRSLYKYARKGLNVERKPREIFIEEFEISKIDLPDLYFSLVCSKGTYVRVIAHDFGAKLDCGGYLKKLRRGAIGNYKVDDAFTLEEFQNMYDSSKLTVE